MKTILIPTFLLFLLACQSNTVKNKIENDELFEVSTDNNEMNAAIEKSISSFKEFENAFNNKKAYDESHAIKINYETPDGGGEHIWIGNLFLKDSVLYGVVNNSPQSTVKVQLGDTIKVDLSKMSDWMYLSKGVLKGGNTLRVIRNQMSTDEKKQFDESVGFIIE